MRKILILGVLVQLTACMSFSDRSFRFTRNSIVEQVPEISLEKEFALSVGNGLLGFLNVVTLDEANISDLNHVQVAVYNVAAGGKKTDSKGLDFAETLRSRGRKSALVNYSKSA